MDYEEERERAEMDAKYEEQIQAEAMAMNEQQEYEYSLHVKEIKDYPLMVIINAIIEHQEKGQICPQTISDLKLILESIEVERRL